MHFILLSLKKNKRKKKERARFHAGRFCAFVLQHIIYLLNVLMYCKNKLRASAWDVSCVLKLQKFDGFDIINEISVSMTVELRYTLIDFGPKLNYLLSCVLAYFLFASVNHKFTIMMSFIHHITEIMFNLRRISSGLKCLGAFLISRRLCY